MYARCKEVECEEYATQDAEAILRTRLRKSCRIYVYLITHQYLTNSQSFRLSEYRANLVKKRESPLGIALPLLNSQDSLRVLCKGSHNF